MARWTFEQRLLAAALLAWGSVALVNLFGGPLLGHDEAMFAVIARDDGLPRAWMYRSRGVTFVAELGLALGAGDAHVRLPFAVLGLGFPLAAFAVGRAAFDARTGAWAAAVLATSHQLLARNAQVLGDVLAAAALLAGVAIVVGELARVEARSAGPRWRLVAAAPAFAAAFYLRYGHAPVIALAVLAALIVWWRVAWRRPAVVLATGALLGALLVPHALHALDQTGDVLGVLRFSAGVPRRAYLGEGLVTYVTTNPFGYYGALVAPVLVAGLGALAVRALRTRATGYVALVAVGQVVIIGLGSHAQPRYVFVAVGLLGVLGVATLRALVAARPAWARLARVAGVALVLAWAGAVIALRVQHARIAARRASIVAAIDAIGADRAARAPDRGCVVIAAIIPQILRWYTRCAGYKHTELDETTLQPHRTRYLIATAYGAIDAAAYARDFTLRIVREVPTRDARTRVWVMQAPSE